MRIFTMALNPTLDVSSDADRVQPTHKVRTRNQRLHPGGGGVNVARVVLELGGSPELMILSGGATGALLEDALGRLPIPLELLHVKSPTRIATMVREEQTGLEYRFVPEGDPISEREALAALQRLETVSDAFVVASGSLPPGAPVDMYARMAAIARKNNCRFVLDTSGPALAAGLSGEPVFFVKPSLSEMEALIGATLEKADAEAAALELVGKGSARYVAVTLGADGAILAGPDGAIRLASPKVEVRSAVGSGDSFVGAFVWALSEEKDSADAFRWAIAAGAATAMTSGTDLCRRGDIESLFARITAVT
ncbi:6-phosphofructokinase 2 [Rhizobium sp. SG_E_25_P2]|uniref:1-phosphofructokinase family hexose kinase n=1 Tax=Rhizobium sp. SG_E_25_P2 TaxID=2879942 RepID=UPI002474A207|nr:hexose kinase [Rhizobium sp. SG_E_25_P2]MDH6265686.1 6-phosphofructokinase 2 [Rhizobium sp. SG_E_25_P2]